MPKTMISDERGVSVIVGALLLILITVVAAASLAMIVSEAQKKEMDRQNQISAVENELLDIISIKLEKNSTDPDIWEKLIFNVQNLNVDGSFVVAVSINDVYTQDFKSLGEEYNFTKRLWIPPAGNRTIEINLAQNFTTAQKINTDRPINVRITTSHINYFEKTYKQPVAIMKVKVETEQLGITDRDYLVLDGTGSYDDGSIVEWLWTIEDNHNPINPVYYTLKGMSATFRPKSDGPFNIKLKVIDENGMEGTTEHITIPANPKFSPPTTMTAEVYTDVINGSKYVLTRITDINGLPSRDVLIYAIINFGDLILEKTWEYTQPNGEAKIAIVNGSGSVTIYAEKLSRNLYINSS